MFMYNYVYGFYKVKQNWLNSGQESTEALMTVEMTWVEIIIKLI